MRQKYCTQRKQVVYARKCVDCGGLGEIIGGLEGTVWDCEQLYQKVTFIGPFTGTHLSEEREHLPVGSMVKYQYTEPEMREFLPLSNIPKTIKTYNPPKQEHQGEDAAVIVEQKGMYVPVYLSAGVDGLAQAVESDMNNLIIFNQLNIKCFNNVIVPLAEDLQKRGLDALKDWGITS